jgi:hypothetical protein
MRKKGEGDVKGTSRFLLSLFVALVLGGGLVGSPGIAGASGAGDQGPGRRTASGPQVASATGHLDPVSTHRLVRPLSAAAREALSRGYLVRDRLAFERAKMMAEKAAPAGPSSASSGPLTPSAFRSWSGQYDTTVTPGDSTGAVGPTRYVELVNLKFGIYSRSSSTALASGTLASFTGDSAGNLSDPQVIWDPDTRRFYYVALDFSYNILDVGFSKTDSPSSAADWCKYSADYGYGTNIPDYPKLGDTRDFWLIGVNVFNSSGTFVRSDVDWITKPAAGSACPAGSTFRIGQKANLLNAGGTKAFTPVPANQTDGSGTGWIVAAKDTTLGSGSFLSVFSVTKNSNGTANIQGTARSLSVSSYSLPPPAPQSGTSKTFDTLDGRLTQAVSAIDPSRSGKVAIWTQHTVAGGAGARIRWYEINPATPALFQSGSASSSSLYVFNGAISPDRAVNGTAVAFGNSMVLGFDTSSASAFEAIQMVSKIGTAAQSGFVLIRQSAGRNVDFSCAPVCRWGDYAGATPDPGASTTAAHGQVWLTSEYNVSSTTNSNVDWRTQNWGVTP